MKVYKLMKGRTGGLMKVKVSKSEIVKARLLRLLVLGKDFHPLCFKCQEGGEP